MSKSIGQKITVKFTEDLVGDISGNEQAFKVTGQEYKYINGPLLDKEYEIASVERYGIRKLWELPEEKELGFTMVEGGEGVNVSNLGTPISYNEFSSLYSDDLAFNGSTSGNGWYASGAIGRWVGLDFNTIPQKVTKFRIYVGDGRFKGYVFEASNNNVDWVPLASGDFASSISWEEVTFSNTTEYKYYHLRCTSVYTGSNVGVKELELFTSSEVKEYDLETIYTFNDMPLEDARILWNENIPAGTDVKIEYKTDTEWMSITKNSVMPISTSLRVILTTEDNSLTPTLLSLWLEEVDAPQNKISITMDDFSRFPTVEGNLTVEYDASVGSLAGRGGPVESFIETFTPTDLVPEPNPGIEETVTVAPAELLAELVEITYSEGFTEETLSAAPAELTVDLVYVGVVNP